MKYCISCQLDITEPRSVVAHSFNRKVSVCSLCGYPVNERHQNSLDSLEKISFVLFIFLSLASFSLAFFLFNLVWWISVILAVVIFVLLKSVDFGLYDFYVDMKLQKALVGMNREDYVVLVNTDERLSTIRKITAALEDASQRYDDRSKQLELLGEVLAFFRQKLYELGNTTKRGALSEKEYFISAAHMAKIGIMHALVITKIRSNEIKKLADFLETSSYMKELNRFIQEISARPFLSTSESADDLRRIADNLMSTVDIAYKQANAYVDTFNFRFKNFEKLDLQLVKMAKESREAADRRVFTNDELLYLENLMKEAFYLMVEFEKEQFATKAKISLDMSFDEIMKIEGALVEFINDFSPAENQLEFWKIVDEFDQMIKIGLERPYRYGRRKDCMG